MQAASESSRLSEPNDNKEATTNDNNEATTKKKIQQINNDKHNDNKSERASEQGKVG
jgi:hypothetical protein